MAHSKNLFGELETQHNSRKFNYNKQVHEYWQHNHQRKTISEMAHDFVMKYFVPKNNTPNLPF